jgi:hypothetical protein
MNFIQNAAEVADIAMGRVNPTLRATYTSLISFLAEFPKAASGMRGASAPDIGSKHYIENQASAFASAREHRAPKAPVTIPDEMVSVILHEYFDIPVADLERAKREHLLAMGAENLVGDLLERYLAAVMEPRGWIWCSGAMVRAVDFVKPPAQVGGKWRLLQVKNRDNSENSSSSAIRLGTDIEKWHRTFSKKVGSNWSDFPDQTLRAHLSEAAFKTFVRDYLRSLRK